MIGTRVDKDEDEDEDEDNNNNTNDFTSLEMDRQILFNNRYLA